MADVAWVRIPASVVEDLTSARFGCRVRGLLPDTCADQAAGPYSGSGAGISAVLFAGVALVVVSIMVARR